MLLLPEEKKQVAVLLNAKIDIAWVPEAMEGQILEHAIGLIDKALEDVLPEPFIGLMRDGGQGIDPDKAKAFGERLIGALNQKINLPYLSEEQEANLLRMMVDPVVQAMIDGQTINDVLDKAKARVAERVSTGDS